MSTATTGLVGWQCHLCTYINASSTSKCKMCMVNKGVTLQTIDVNQNEDRSTMDVGGDSDFMKLRSTYENYMELAELDATDLITCLDHFDCPICLTTCAPGEGITLKDCLHTYCRECIAQTVEHSAEAEIRCPYRDDEYFCGSLLQEREIKALLSPEAYDKYLARSVTEAEQKIPDAFHCKTANCKGWCILDHEEDLLVFQCPICNQNNCIACKAIHPTTISCEDYRLSINTSESERASAAKLQTMLDTKIAMNCPTCKVMITKIDGCDGMTCSLCKTAICWATRGPRWGPRGHGDTSGGCRCRVNGKKCHPSCGNCH